MTQYRSNLTTNLAILPMMIGAVFLSSCAVQNTKPVSSSMTQATEANAQAQAKDAIETTHHNSVRAIANPLDISELRSRIAACSPSYQQSALPILNKYQPTTLSYQQLATQADYQQLIKIEKESAICQQESLIGLENIIEVNHQVIAAELSNPNLSPEQQREWLQRLLDSERQLFELNIHLGLATPGTDELAYWHQAHSIWMQWQNTPIAIDDLESLLRAAMITEVMTKASTSLTNYLQTYHASANTDEDSELGDKRDLILNQTFIYLAQLDERNREAKQQLSSRAQSAPWLDKMASEYHQAFPNKPISADKIENTIMRFLEQDERSYMAQFIKLTNLRYQDFTDAQMLESAKTFLVEDAEQLPMSQLLAAMDYAKLGDKVSSERWLKQAFNHEDMPYKLCQMLTLDLSQQSPFFSEANGQWFQAQINQYCKS